MKLDATNRGIPAEEVGSWSRRCAKLGFDGLVSTETNNDPYTGSDLHGLTGGRFVFRGRTVYAEGEARGEPGDGEFIAGRSARGGA